jgi:hypothetical protein
MAILDQIKKQIGQFVKSPAEELFPQNISIAKKNLSAQMPSSFEQTYKMAYSHGLESIYALQDIDATKIRPIGNSNDQQKENSTKENHHSLLDLEQLEFDFGYAYRGWSEPFILDEPIQVLSLSRHAEKCLMDQGKNLLKDLKNANLQDFVFIKGMGQGHIDEIRQKLNRYIENYPLSKCDFIDFGSWIRTLVASSERKKIWVALEAYGLSELVSLSPAESVEVRRQSFEKKQEWLQEIQNELRSKNVSSAKANMQKIVEIFLKPWIRGRKGFATESELMERLQRISYQTRFALPGLQFFQEVFFDNVLPLKPYLIEGDCHLFFADQHTVDAFHRIIHKAGSYFYKSSISYPLPSLILFLQRELSLSWSDADPDFIEKTLKLSSIFQVYKTPKGQAICLG